MILAIDPGLVTGWALWNGPDKTGFDSGMVKGRFEFYEWFYKLLTFYYAKDASTYMTGQRIGLGQAGLASPPFQVIMEMFTITQQTARKSPQVDPWRIIGHIEAVCHRDGIPLEFQTPSSAMAFSTNEKLKVIEWYKPGAGHDNDAARHLLLYMIKNKSESLLTAKLTESLGVVQ